MLEAPLVVARPRRPLQGAAWPSCGWLPWGEPRRARRQPALAVRAGPAGRGRHRARLLCGLLPPSGLLLALAALSGDASSCATPLPGSPCPRPRTAEPLSSAAGARCPPELALLPRRGLLAAASALGLPGLAPGPAAALTGDEKRVASLFEVTTPSVVSISKSAPQAVLGEEKPTGAVYGTGFVWDKNHVVTNFHVVNGMERTYITFLAKDERRTTLDATIVGADPASDIAVLRVGNQTKDGKAASAALMRALPRGTSGDLVVGQDVFAFGNPFGLEHSLSRGIVSGVARTMEGAGGRPINGIIQTDASINPGNSGGPLLDSDGKVIGVNAAILTGSGTFAGVGLAIPIDTVEKNVGSIIAKGAVFRPFLGIVFAPDVMAEELQLNGIMVMKVVAGGPAESAGVRPMRGGRLGDILVAVDGKRCGTAVDLYKILDQRKPGDQVRLQVQRASADLDSDKYEDVELEVTLGTSGGEKKKG